MALAFVLGWKQFTLPVSDYSSHPGTQSFPPWVTEDLAQTLTPHTPGPMLFFLCSSHSPSAKGSQNLSSLGYAKPPPPMELSTSTY